MTFLIISCGEPGEKISGTSAKPEVIYHVVQRSFYDSNGDLQGDLNGLRQKLDYLQDLGVTSILLLPLYQSVYYHNYFSSDFKKIDSTFGTKEDYLNLVKVIHRRGMKLYMDMETQYVTEETISGTRILMTILPLLIVITFLTVTPNKLNLRPLSMT